jgi:hypothetical protein
MPTRSSAGLGSGRRAKPPAFKKNIFRMLLLTGLANVGIFTAENSPGARVGEKPIFSHREKRAAFMKDVNRCLRPSLEHTPNNGGSHA